MRGNILCFAKVHATIVSRRCVRFSKIAQSGHGSGPQKTFQGKATISQVANFASRICTLPAARATTRLAPYKVVRRCQSRRRYVRLTMKPAGMAQHKPITGDQVVNLLPSCVRGRFLGGVSQKNTPPIGELDPPHHLTACFSRFSAMPAGSRDRRTACYAPVSHLWTCIYLVVYPSVPCTVFHVRIILHALFSHCTASITPRCVISQRPASKTPSL